MLIADPLLVRITEWSEASGFGRTAPMPGAPLGVSIVDVFTCEGEFLGEIELRDAVSSLAVRGDRLAAVVRRLNDELERHGVDVYEMR